MTTTTLLAHIDRDSRRRERIAAGSPMARYVRRADVSYLGASLVPHNAFVKPRGLSIPEGVVVIAARCEGAIVRPLLIEAFEGDAAAFASFPRLAHMLGATELHLVTKPGTMLERIQVARDLAARAAARRDALLSRPLAVAGAFDRSAIMATACAVAKVRQSVTGETWAACLSAALKGIWILARAARATTAH